DKNIKFIVRGLSFVFVYDARDDYQPPTNIEGVEQYIIGSQSIVSIIESLPEFNLVSSELTWPKFMVNTYQNVVINSQSDTKDLSQSKNNSIFIPEKNIELEREQGQNSNQQIVIDNEQKPDNLIDQQAIKNEIIKLDDESEAEEVSTAVKKVVHYHKQRAKVLKFLFTPNAVRISLAAEMGWNPNIFYKMTNDFLAVERLKLLRVEVVPGSYDLVFARKHRQVIYYQDCLANRELSSGGGNTKILIGRNEQNNEIVYYNLDSEDPHALIAGMTKSGKSVLLNIFIVDLIRTNTTNELKLILVDPKQVEFTRYKNIPYLDEDGIITDKNLAIEKLLGVVDEMESRYTLFQEAGVNDLTKYNVCTVIKMPRIVLIFDEFADWMLDDDFKKKASDAIQRLAGKARAAGIHLIVSTQRPDNTVVPAILRANLGAKFALRVDTEKNSNIIIDEPGAEKLLGYGHLIARFAGEKLYVQSAFMADEYIDKILAEI
ncbi:MAG: FtsK/SpoIIIE domain-containing protein, partial [Woeseiaceae bacterium]